VPSIQKLPYRPEIDGLRGVAVLAVISFHAGLGCRGGYVGVDVFFVISGFLITSLIWKGLEDGSFKFVHFWERRARRIIPAMVLITIVTLVAGWFVLLPADLKNLGQASAAQAVFGANIHYWRDTGYFSGTPELKPLIHVWSLAIEEQFYLIIPILLWASFRTLMRRSRKAIPLILGVGFIFSFALNLELIKSDPETTFYFHRTRAWELLLGSLIAFFPAPRSSTIARRTQRELLALSGLALILVPVFIYTRQTQFPGLAALPPCLGAAIIILANGSNRTLVGSLLSARPLVFIGLSSYSLYLWHWPLLAFSNYLALVPPSLGIRFAIVAAGCLLGVVSWKYVETPFRRRRVGRSRKSMFAFTAAGLAIIFACGLLLVIKQGFPQRYSAWELAYAKAVFDKSFINELTSKDVHAERLVLIGDADSTLRPTVLVWGDSYAMAALPAVDVLLKEKRLVGRAATHSATAPVLKWFSRDGLGEDAVAFNDGILAYVKSHQIRDVLLIANWRAYLGGRAFSSSLLATVTQLSALGARSWIVLTPPAYSFDVPIALARSVPEATLILLSPKPPGDNEFESDDPTLVAEIEKAGGRILDAKPRFLDRTGQHYIIQSDGIALYRDRYHLTTKGALLILLPFLRDSLPLER